jgi:hypothetical protein
MIRAEQIPDEVVEPVARALCIAEGCDPERLRLKSSDKLWTAWADEARATIAAALNAWPGSCNVACTLADLLLLPLPQGAAAPLEPRDE